MKIYFITATDTNAGKTMTAAALMKQYEGAHYWKPVQTGSDRDGETVQKLSGAAGHRFHTGITLSEPLSPHRAAELDGTEVRLDDLDGRYGEVLNRVSRASDSAGGTAGPVASAGSAIASGASPEGRQLFIEGAGGILVPLNRKQLWPDWLQGKELSVILVCRTGLGTINHSLLSIEALRSRNMTIAGLIFFGPENQDNQRTICEISGVPMIGQFQVSHECKGPSELPEALDVSWKLL